MPLNTVVFSADGKTLFSSIFESSIKQWDLRTGKVTRVLSGHQDGIYALTISPNGQYLVSGSSDGTIRVWQAATGILVRSHKTNESISALKISPNGQILASATSQLKIRVGDH
jgi:WD40 repeat protein